MARLREIALLNAIPPCGNDEAAVGFLEFKVLAEKPTGEHCNGMEGVIEEGGLRDANRRPKPAPQPRWRRAGCAPSSPPSAASFSSGLQGTARGCRLRRPGFSERERAEARSSRDSSPARARWWLARPRKPWPVILPSYPKGLAKELDINESYLEKLAEEVRKDLPG